MKFTTIAVLFVFTVGVCASEDALQCYKCRYDSAISIKNHLDLKGSKDHEGTCTSPKCCSKEYVSIIGCPKKEVCLTILVSRKFQGIDSEATSRKCGEKQHYLVNGWKEGCQDKVPKYKQLAEPFKTSFNQSANATGKTCLYFCDKDHCNGVGKLWTNYASVILFVTLNVTLLKMWNS